MFRELIFQVDGVAVCWEGMYDLIINRSSVGTIRVTDRDANIERIQGVGVSVKRRMQSVMRVSHAQWNDKH